MLTLEKKNKQFDKRKQDWLVQKFGLCQLQRLDAIQAVPLVYSSSKKKEYKKRLCLQGNKVDKKILNFIFKLSFLYCYKQVAPQIGTIKDF